MNPFSLTTGIWCRWGSRCQDTKSAFFAVFRDSRTEPSPLPSCPQEVKDGARVTQVLSLSLQGLGAVLAHPSLRNLSLEPGSLFVFKSEVGV